MLDGFNSAYYLRHKLIEVLLGKGYPEESLMFEWKKGEVQYDLAVIDPKTSEMLAIFEFKLEHKFIFSTEKLSEKLTKYATLDIEKPIPLYIVSATDGEQTYDISKLIFQTKNSSMPEFISIKELPDYETLRNKTIAQTNKKYKDWFRIKSSIFGWVFSILLIMDWIGKITISYQRLVILGIICGLFLAPDVYRLKILGFEVERHEKNNIINS